MERLVGALSVLERLSGLHRLVLIADAVDGLQIVERRVFAAEEVADLDDVLVERTTANVGVDTPNRVNEILPCDDRFGVLMEIGENPDFFAADRNDLAVRENDFHLSRANGCSVEVEWRIGETHVFGDVEVVSDLCSA